MKDIKGYDIIEEWKDIEGYEGLYQVSNLGNVKSLPRKGTQGGLLKPAIKWGGYYGVALTKNGRTKWFRINRLVLQAFKPIQNPEKFEGDHINRNRLDNRLENLQWLTHGENTKKDWSKRVHCIETGRVYNAIVDALRELGVKDNSSDISRVCKGKRITAYGYHWEYVD